MRKANNQKNLNDNAGKFGIKIVNRGRSKSFNKFQTLPYSKLTDIKNNENVYRADLKRDKDKRRINNLDDCFKPKIDPRVLRHALK